MSKDLSKFDITLNRVQYQAVPETAAGGCDGCAFQDRPYTCSEATAIVSCGSHEIIWIKKVKPECIPDSTKEAEVASSADSANNSDKPAEDVRSYNVGNSNYAKHKIQPWDIWLEYDLNAWDADIVKRVLRHKEGESREMDYEKIIHICRERIRQLKLGLK